MVIFLMSFIRFATYKYV